MSETLKINGERYTGHFVANRIENEFWVGSEYTTALHRGHRYTGTGLIIDSTNGERHYFALQTERFDDSEAGDYSLEDSIVYFNQKGPFYGESKPILTSPEAYKKIVDMSLGRIVAKVRGNKEKIPIITPEKMKLEDLVNMGLILSKTGQVILPLSSN